MSIPNWIGCRASHSRRYWWVIARTASLSVIAVALLGIAVATRNSYEQSGAGWKSSSIPGLVIDRMVAGFGNAAPGSRPSVEFRLRNVGGVPIRINKVVTQCSCETTHLTGTTIKPGATDVLRVQVALPQDAGLAVRKRVWIFCSIPGSPALKAPLGLEVFGTVGTAPPIIAFPDRLVFVGAVAGGQVVGTVYLQGQRRILRHLPPTVVITADKPAKIRIPGDVAQAPTGYRRLKVRWLLPGSPWRGWLKNSVIIKTEGSEIKVATLAIIGKRQ